MFVYKLTKRTNHSLLTSSNLNTSFNGSKTEYILKFKQEGKHNDNTLLVVCNTKTKLVKARLENVGNNDYVTIYPFVVKSINYLIKLGIIEAVFDRFYRLK